MVIRKERPLRWWATVATILLIIAVGLPIGVNIWYTNRIIHNECQAVGIISRTHLHIPRFRQAIIQWYKADGC